MISSEVEHVCGRCITLLEYRNYEFAKSLYNIVASERLKDTATGKVVRNEVLTEIEEQEKQGDVDKDLKMLQGSINKVNEKYLKSLKQMQKS
ncbi:hypothetical protein HUJ04_010200 [Dendroctonus ponderosae]|nr:hypothetical protein HUJ04_010200 [Dendroctonus ponderosae]